MLKFDVKALQMLDDGLGCLYSEGMSMDEDKTIELSNKIRGFIKEIEESGKGYIVVAFINAEMTEMK